VLTRPQRGRNESDGRAQADADQLATVHHDRRNSPPALSIR
jgi:hypothetical protein